MIHASLMVLALASGGFGSFTGTGSKGGGGTSVVVRPATVGWYGDSRTQGACSSTPPPNALDALLPGGPSGGYVVANKGIAGETAHEIYTRVASGAGTACVGEPCGHYIVAGGVNTLKSANYSASSAAAVAQVALNGIGTCEVEEVDSCGTMDSVDRIHALYPNARVFVIGELPYGGCDNITCPNLVEPHARATAYNAALQSACASRAWLTCLLPYDDFADPENEGHILQAYECADGIHLLEAGSAALAQEVFEGASW